MRSSSGARHRIGASLLVLVVGSLVVAAAARHRQPRTQTAPDTRVVAPTRPAARTGHSRGDPTGAGPPASSSSTSAAADPAALSAADQFVTAYAGYDWRRPSGNPASWRQFVTPALYARLTGPATSSTGMTPLQIARHETAVAGLQSTTWESGSADVATVLVDCVLTVTADGSPPQELDTPYPLTLSRSDTGWLVASVGAAG